MIATLLIIGWILGIISSLLFLLISIYAIKDKEYVSLAIVYLISMLLTGYITFLPLVLLSFILLMKEKENKL
jgi:hypothetical protein